MIYCIDIDDTICHSIEDDYAQSVPCAEAVSKINKLYDDGHTIKLFTGRGSWDNSDWGAFTENQLQSWGVKYHELLFHKPYADVFIDDKAINSRDWLHADEQFREVKRPWGKEIWIVNCAEYCGKLLYVPKGAISEYHYHDIKKETFYCLKGQVGLTLEGSEIILDMFSRPVTILPKQRHSFYGNTNALILEISTHHSETDSVFLSEASKHAGS